MSGNISPNHVKQLGFIVFEPIMRRYETETPKHLITMAMSTKTASFGEICEYKSHVTNY